MRFFFLVFRGTNNDLFYEYKTMHSLLDLTCDTVFTTPDYFGLRGHVVKIHRRQCKTRRRQHAFCILAVHKWNKLPGEILNDSSVEMFKTRFHAL